MVKTNKTAVAPKKHEDRLKAEKTTFESTNVNIQSAQTMILLLASKEDVVLLKAISTLDKYASKLEQNVCLLYEEGILKVIVPLLRHGELVIQRFAVKLLSELCFLPQVVEELVKEEFIKPVTNILESSADLVVQEFALSIIAELTRSDRGIDQLGRTELIKSLHNYMIFSDPDIQKHSLQIIFNIVKEPGSYEMLATNINFDIPTFINLFMSEYPTIQNLSLDIMTVLTQKQKGNKIPGEFQNDGGVKRLMSILKNREWEDLHSKCLDVIGNIYNDDKIAQNFLKDDVLQLFTYMETVSDMKLKKKAICVIGTITNTALGRKVISENGQVVTLAKLMLQPTLTEAVCQCTAGLVPDHLALQQLLAHETVPNLLEVLYNDIYDFEAKTAAINALYEILQRDQTSCQAVVSSGRLEVFNTILKQYNKAVSITAPIMALNCIKTLADDADLRQEIISPSLMESLLYCFTEFPEDTVPLRVAACETLSSLITEPEARRLLRELDGLPAVWTAVTTNPRSNLPLLTSAATFLHLSLASDSQLATDFMRLGALNWLLSQKGLRAECPAWEVALETLFNKFLPAKFAFTGRLDMTDVTENNFYITRTPLTREELDANKFPLLADLTSNSVCPVKMVYIANFEEIGLDKESVSTISKRSTISKKKSSQQSVVEPSSVKSSGSFPCSGKFIFNDPYLIKCLETVRSILSRNGFSCEDISWKNDVIDSSIVRKKALLIGQFVADQMAGTDQSEKCTTHTLDLHINEIKVEIENNIIPIGWMRVGLHMERALLFKVLADRVGLPASLVRGSRGRRGWVELAVPLLPPEPRPVYPVHLLRPNYVLDLMASPIALYPLGSYEADVYRGLMEKVLQH